ncbi:hypothetical protein IAE23_24955 [Bacillus sp. S35]|nr:hypothetical protein [Priestia aryabhattai]MBK0009725.1 hypothetical protein [Bacillus sp. S35]MCM3644465.1 hypothetical protein [Priestia aryabhattai]
MDNDSIILELLARIQKLEEKVKTLEKQLENSRYTKKAITMSTPKVGDES